VLLILVVLPAPYPLHYFWYIMYSKYALMALAALIASAMTLSTANAFVVPKTTLSSSGFRASHGSIREVLTHGASSALSMSSESSSEASKKIVVVSPPGGVGEAAAVSAAKLGNSVRWFVVSGSEAASSSSVSLPSSVLDAIATAGGTIELAGADASSLLLPPDDASSAIGAVSKWCGSADGLVCTYDGAAADNADAEASNTVMNAVKVAAREAAGSVAKSGRVAVLPAPTAADAEEDEDFAGASEISREVLMASPAHIV